MIQRQELPLTLWWQHLELLALFTLPPFALCATGLFSQSLEDHVPIH